MAVGEVAGCCKSLYFGQGKSYFSQGKISEKSGNFKVDLLCEPGR